MLGSLDPPLQPLTLYYPQRRPAILLEKGPDEPTLLHSHQLVQ